MEDFDSWNNKDEIVASMLKYSPAGSEGVDSCVENCEYGDYWNGSECTEGADVCEFTYFCDF